jgi:hypothetical protein
MMRSIRSALAVLLFAVSLGQSAPPASGADKSLLRLNAQAVNLSGVGPATTGSLDIAIERWSTDEEREKLRAALAEKAPDALLSALQKLKPRAGYIRDAASTSVAWNVRFAREHPLPDGGRRIIIATERPMGYWELVNRPRSADYAFTLAEIRLDKNGKGEGKLVPAAKVSWNKDKGAIEITNYGTEPVRLVNITAERAS